MVRYLFFSFLSHFLSLTFFSLFPFMKAKKSFEYPIVYEVSIEPKISEKKEVISDVEISKKSKAEIKPRDTLKKTVVDKKELVKNKGLGIKSEGGAVSSFYLNVILSRIAENWYNPYRHSNIYLKTVIFFKITKEGEIKEVKVEKPSLRADYDEYCKRAVMLTKNLPPLPEEMKIDFLKVHLEFESKP